MSSVDTCWLSDKVFKAVLSKLRRHLHTTLGSDYSDFLQGEVCTHLQPWSMAAPSDLHSGGKNKRIHLPSPEHAGGIPIYLFPLSTLRLPYLGGGCSSLQRNSLGCHL